MVSEHRHAWCSLRMLVHGNVLVTADVEIEDAIRELASEVGVKIDEIEMLPLIFLMLMLS